MSRVNQAETSSGQLDILDKSVELDRDLENICTVVSFMTQDFAHHICKPWESPLVQSQVEVKATEIQFSVN